MNNLRYEKAIEKNLDELQRAMLIRVTIKGIEAAGHSDFLFLKLVYNSLLNDYLAKCIKVFEESKQALSFWYIFRSNEKKFKDIIKKQNIDFNESKFRDISKKLKKLRDQSHFHFDSEGVLDIQKVWEKAELSDTVLHESVSTAQLILFHLAIKLNVKYETLPPYHVRTPYRIASAINNGKW